MREMEKLQEDQRSPGRTAGISVDLGFAEI